MKVLFFNYEYPPLGGGAANATTYIFAEYAKMSDLEIDLVTSSVDDQYHLEKVGEKIFIHRLPIGKNPKNLHFQSQKDLLLYSWRAFWFSKKLIKEKKYSLSHSFFSVPCGFLSLLLKWQYKIPYIVSLRGADVPGYSDRFSAIYGLLTPIIRLVWKKASFVVANSQDLKELALKTKTKKHIDVIYNGIDTNHFVPDYSKRQDSKFIITLGASRVTARKGINFLIEAIFKLAEKYPQIYLKVLGDGNEKDNLENMARDLKLEKNVEFVGRVPREETLKYYQEASLFVLPSLNEGMSNAMLEALSSGLPIITTDTGGAKELVDESVNGFIVKMKDTDDLRNKIENFLKDKNLVKIMGEKSRERALQMSWGNVSEKYHELYKSIS